MAVTERRRLYTGGKSAERGLLDLQIAAAGALLIAALFVFFFNSAKHDPRFAGLNPFADDPFDAVGSFGFQLAAAGAVIAAIRAFRTDLKTESLSNRYTYTLRSVAVSLLAIVVTTVADLAALLRQAIALDWYFPSISLLGFTASLFLVASGFCAYIIRLAQGRGVCSKNPLRQRQMIPLLILVILLACYPAGWREGVAGSIVAAVFGIVFLFLSVGLLSKAMFPCPDIPERDLVDDVCGIFTGFVRHSAQQEHSDSSRSVFALFSPRKHEWRLLALVSVIAGLLLACLELVHGNQQVDFGRGALVALLFVGLESAGIFLGYALLRRFLGIIRSA